MAQRSRRSGRVIIYLALILILVLAVVAFIFRDRLTSSFTQQPPASTPLVQQEEMVDIVITAQAVPRGTIFSSDVLTTIKYPKKDFVAAGIFYTNVNDVIGKVAKVSLDARVPLTQSLVVESGSLNAQEIPAGMVAISIPLRNRVSSVSYAPWSGDHVNIIAALTFVDLDPNFQTVLPDKVGQVIAPSAGGATPVTPPELSSCITTDGTDAINKCKGNTQGNAVLDPSLQQPLYTYPSESQRPRLVSQTLVQDAIVLGVGDFLLPGELKAATTQYPDTITLIVAPQDAVTLNYLIYAGAELTLVLRRSGDTQRVQTEAVTLQYLMDQYNISLPAKLPYGTDPRMDVATPIAPLQLDPRYNIPTPGPTPIPGPTPTPGP